MKIVNIDKDNFEIFEMIWKISVKFSGKIGLMIIIKVTRDQDFALFPGNAVLEKQQGVKIDPPVF